MTFTSECLCSIATCKENGLNPHFCTIINTSHSASPMRGWAESQCVQNRHCSERNSVTAILINCSKTCTLAAVSFVIYSARSVTNIHYYSVRVLARRDGSECILIFTKISMRPLLTERNINISPLAPYWTKWNKIEDRQMPSNLSTSYWKIRFTRPIHLPSSLHIYIYILSWHHYKNSLFNRVTQYLSSSFCS